MVVAIAVEAPLKFRAPGITLPLGLGIGRLVFRALNASEIVLATATATTFALAPRPLAATEARAALIIDGVTPPKSRAHLAYIALEGAKVLMLVTFGIVLMLAG
ncbi:hypothetical protein C8D87_108182 [Lentzea atacamensis]|uniref:Uncharacterized protein n=2 Tax=Lentzea atacamensis TaxID=531938 RepID=A0ABX9E370_9PSEU|nr:hypothetical protein C8D87_108182 [Lentzea atacamensis]